MAGGLIIILMIAVALFRSLTSGASTPGGSLPFFEQLYEDEIAGPGRFPVQLASAQPTDLCTLCDCGAAVPFYAPNAQASANFGLPSRPPATDVYPTPDTVDVNEFICLTILDIYCARQHLIDQQALRLVARTANHLPEMMAWSLSGLQIGKPTIYMTTATSPTMKSGRWNTFRPQYFRRHGRMMRSWMVQQEARVLKAKSDLGSAVRDWQVVWIIAEDSIEIDPLVVRILQRTGISFVYFAYGMTKSWGNAQKNAVLQMVYALSRAGTSGLYGHGPVYGLDDDNKILPNLLDRLIEVVRLGVFPVGNLSGDDGWEKALIDETLSVVVGGLFDYGSFTYNSTVLGTLISGPSFWKITEHAGEHAFLAQFGPLQSFELLCGKSKAQDCHNVWHNEPLTKVEMLTDEEEIAYVRKYGAAKLFQELGFSAVTSKD
ncbi:putative glycosyltransferase family 43 protein [Elsinoe australis]|uniref:Putative glycosyltransferase family 43 protein n=1 Tax=Elsinoe australis TaxID=40998 RepID=A0A4U7B145_9PEZI|nr:putative glycosyltransferase family 43 protein [Elsinoe australis]